MMIADTADQAIESAAGPIALNASDRCDRCGAQAYVVTGHAAGPLHWCNHHFRRYERVLADWVLLDSTSLLHRSPAAPQPGQHPSQTD